MASRSITGTANTAASQLQSLIPEERNWQRWLSGAISFALFATILWKLRSFGFDAALQTLPVRPIFWFAFAGYYLALPSSEWLIFRRLWNLPAAGFAALLRKLVSNEVLFGYSGEVYFYAWARRHARLVAAPFGAIKDVSILSALAGNLITLVMVGFAWPLVGKVAPQFHPHAVFLSAAAIIGTSMALLAFKSRIFSLGRADLQMIFGVHLVRLLATTLLSGVMWHTALPEVPLVWLLVLATMQLLVTRLPFVPNKDLVFASLAIFLIGHDSQVAALIAVIAGLILAVHLTIGGLLVLADLFEARGP
jgi:hypothetical protein